MPSDPDINDEMVHAVRTLAAPIRMGVPLDAVVHRGRRLRVRRRAWEIVVAGAAAGTVASAFLVQGAGPATPAWAVTTQPTGDVLVTLHRLTDPAGLERNLRARGVPVLVSFDAGSSLCYDRGAPPVKTGAVTWVSPETFRIHLAAIPENLQLALRLTPGFYPLDASPVPRVLSLDGPTPSPIPVPEWMVNVGFVRLDGKCHVGATPAPHAVIEHR
jgi:hypothetical protein